MKKILIMGGNQFVGRAIAKKFLTENHQVYVLNRGSRKNLDGAIFLKVDRNNLEEMQSILKEIDVDVIVDVSGYTKEEVEILQDVMKGKFKHYIFISSASVYSKLKNSPAFENDEIGENLIWGEYAKNKFLAERKVIENSKLNNFIYTIFRPFYIYGIGNNLERENYFFSRLKYNLPIYIPNDGKNLVQFGYIDDLVNVVELATRNTDYHNQIFNISGDEYISLTAFIEVCGKVMGKKPIMRYVDTIESNLKARDWFPFRDVSLFGDISKIESTGYRNQFSLIKGLEKTYKYNEENNLITYPVLNEVEKSFSK